MEYEPIKAVIAQTIRNSAMMRKILFNGLHLVFLRSWYTRREFKRLPWNQCEPISILDAGSGFGQYSYSLVRRFKQATLLGRELNPNHVADSNQFAKTIDCHRMRFEEADLTQMTDKEQFDLILSVDVLEHIEHDVDLLTRYQKGLKPGGRLIISTPSTERERHEDGKFVDEHFRDGYSEADIRDKMTQAGLTIERLVFGYGFWGDYSWRMGIRNTMKMLENRWTRLLAPVYFIVTFPFVLMMMILDFIWPNKKGTGLVVTAMKETA